MKIHPLTLVEYSCHLFLHIRSNNATKGGENITYCNVDNPSWSLLIETVLASCPSIEIRMVLCFLDCASEIFRNYFSAQSKPFPS